MSQRKLLIVEDEPDIVVIYKDIIQAAFPDVTVHCESNGLEGFLACQKEHYNLILTDHKMPFMTGAALIVALRTKENLNKLTTILMITGFLDSDLRKKLDLQNVDFLEKPVNPTTLIEELTPYLI